MGFRFRKSINLGGGFRINLSKSGIGYSWGFPGFRATKTSKGTTRLTASIPGTGLSYVEETGKKGKPQTDKKFKGEQGGENAHMSQDELLKDAIKRIFKEGVASTSLLQRRLKVGYRVADDLIGEMEQMKIIGPFTGAHSREILIREDQLYDYTGYKSFREGASGMDRLKLIGQMNRVLLVKDDIIKFVDLGGLFSSMKKEKFLSVADVTSVEVKKPDLYPGYIQFQISGQTAPNIAGRGARYVSVVSAATDENSVTFVGDNNYQIALAMQRHIQAFNTTSKLPVTVSAVSVADEILKYKALLDGGIITQEEFDAQKKTLLSK